MRIPLRPPARVLASSVIGAIGKVGSNRLSLVAAGVGFFGMLSIFPALAALIALLSLITEPNVAVVQLEEFRDLMPADVFDILHAQVLKLVTTSSSELGWAGLISILVAFWSARAGVGAMMQGLNAVYGLKSRAGFRHYVRALLLTFALLAVGIVALLTVVVAPVVLAFLPLGSTVSVILDGVRWIIGIVVIFVGIGLLYRFGPNRSNASSGWLTPGSVFSVLAWACVSIAFSTYVAQFGSYNEVYGSIGAVMAMLVWLWISSLVVLFGAAINAEIERRLISQSTQDPENQAQSPLAPLDTNEALGG
ncbi:MAG: YihY/virulence factor BrkB family protein [Pseudomonadota bacterium]